MEVKNDTISRQAAIDALETDRNSIDSLDIDYGIKRASLGRAIWRLEELPSAQPDVIRCKDCINAHLTDDGHCEYCDRWQDDEGYLLELYVDEKFFCGHARRKEDD